MIVWLGPLAALVGVITGWAAGLALEMRRSRKLDEKMALRLRQHDRRFYP